MNTWSDRFIKELLNWGRTAELTENVSPAGEEMKPTFSELHQTPASVFMDPHAADESVAS